MVWTQRRLFEVLSKQNQEWVKRGDGQGHNEPGTLTWLYRQSTDCAVLYSPDKETNRPLHLNPGRPEWKTEIYKEILPAIKSVHLEQRAQEDRRRSFLHCEVRDPSRDRDETVNGWKIIAEALGLGDVGDVPGA